MDYECDVGYERAPNSKTCVKIEDYEKLLGASIKEDQAAQCETFGFYTVTQGYRKIPGNRCMGGLDRNPYTYSCSGLGGFFSLKTLLTYLVIGLALYYGWPLIEALLILLPIPDPKEILEKLKSFVSGTVQ